MTCSSPAQTVPDPRTRRQWLVALAAASAATLSLPVAVKQMIDRGADAERVESMAGGIDAWSDEIDPTLPRY